MDKFSQDIKNKIKNYEVPYNEASWNRLSKKLPNRRNKILTYSFVSVILIVFGIFIFNNTTTLPTIKTNKEIVLVPDNVIVENVVQPIIQEPQKEDFVYAEYECIEEDIEIEDLVFDEEEIVEIKPQKLETVFIEPILPDSILETRIVETTEIYDSILKKQIPKTQYTIPDLFFANAFTPNHDGLNEDFFPVGNLEDFPFQMLIYNRFGELIFETINKNHKWEGHSCKEGLYVYVFIIQFDNGNTKEYKGTVTLIK